MATSVDTTAIKDIYDEFMTKSMAALTALQQDTGMEDEHLASAAAAIITGAMESAVKAFHTIKSVELIGAQKADVEKTTMIREAQHAKDMLIKDQQELAEKLKNGGLYYAYTYNPDGTLASKTLVNGTRKSVYEAQIEKLEADTDFVRYQKLQLGYSVTYNNRLKISESYGDMLGNLGLGGLNVSSDMWSVYFNMINDVYTNYGEAPVSKTISVPAASALVLTKIV